MIDGRESEGAGYPSETCHAPGICKMGHCFRIGYGILIWDAGFLVRVGRNKDDWVHCHPHRQAGDVRKSLWERIENEECEDNEG